MNKIAVGIIATIIVLTLVFVALGTGIFESPYWETENEFGMWQEEIVIEYVDGTEQSLKLIQGGGTGWYPFAVIYEGKEIDRVMYRIFGTATGVGYDSATVDISNLYIKDEIIPMGPSHSQIQQGEISMPLNQRTEICKRSIYLRAQMEGPPEWYPDGDYVVTFSVDGVVRFRGEPGGEWITATLPTGKSLTVTFERGVTGQIVLTLSSDVLAQEVD